MHKIMQYGIKISSLSGLIWLAMTDRLYDMLDTEQLEKVLYYSVVVL